MLGFVREVLANRKSKALYWSKLQEFLVDDRLDEREKGELKDLAEELGLSEQELRDAHKKAASLNFTSISSDGKITDEEKEAMEDIATHFGLQLSDFNFDQKSFNKLYALGLIEKGVLPNINNHDIDVIFKPGEILHWGCGSALVKYKRVTQRINYGGVTASVKIMKGMRYRVGSINVQTVSKELLVTEDTGAFWLTNQRIGFRGARKNFAIQLNKVAYFEVTGAGLVIAKDGRENPYIIQLEDYEVPAAILSHLLNR